MIRETAQSGNLQDGSFDIEIFGTGIALVLVSITWITAFWRNQLMRQITLYRMREIEAQLGMAKNMYVHAWDNLETLGTDNSSQSVEARWSRAHLRGESSQLIQFFSRLGRSSLRYRILKYVGRLGPYQTPAFIGLFGSITVMVLEIVHYR